MTNSKKNTISRLKENLLNRHLNISAIIISALLTLLLVKALSLLPEEYYFGFGKMVDSNSDAPFLVSPPKVNLAQYDKILSDMKINYDTPSEKLKQVDEVIIEKGQFHFWISLLLKMLPPFFVGYFLFFLWKQDAMPALPIGAGLAAFMLTWPVVLLWDSVVHDVWYQQKNLFLVMYIAYVLLYYNLARLGVILGKLSFDFGFVKAGKVEVNWGKTFSSLITSGITATITWFVTTAIARA